MRREGGQGVEREKMETVRGSLMMERAAREVERRETNEVKMGQRANYL